jgi:type II restriction enzyme
VGNRLEFPSARPAQFAIQKELTVHLAMNPSLGIGYKSRSQIARILTEDWAASNLYCAACDHANVSQTRANTHAVDFTCRGCNAGYQLKAGGRWNEQRIPDAGYEPMIKAIRSDNVPNLLVMQYNPSWMVSNLILVPSFFFTETAIQKRKPLSPNARRAGWVGCNILLCAIPPEGKIRLVTDSIPSDPQSVRSQYVKIKPIATLKTALRGWTLNVLRVVHKVGKTQFGLDDIYGFEAELAKLFPGNHNIRPKIRQQLQILRDIRLIDFLGGGCYSLRP